MPKLKPDTQRARRQHILDAAERCFGRDGFHRTTMHDICREAGVSPGALYVYFDSKEALIAGIAERDRAEFAERFDSLATIIPLASLETFESILPSLREAQATSDRALLHFSYTTPVPATLEALREISIPCFTSPLRAARGQAPRSNLAGIRSRACRQLNSSQTPTPAPISFF